MRSARSFSRFRTSAYAPWRAIAHFPRAAAAARRLLTGDSMISTLRELSMRGPVRAPRHAMAAPAEIPAWRWFALVAVVFAIAHDKIHRQAEEIVLPQLLAGARLMPSASVLGLWSLILLALAAFAVFQLGEEQRRLSVYDRASRPLVLLCALAGTQLFALQEDSGLPAVAGLTAATALAAGLGYYRVQDEIAEERASAWIGVPFSLVLAYTGGTAMTALDAVVAQAGGTSTAYAIGMLAAAGAGAIYLGLSRRDVVLPGFAAWILASICVERPPAAIATAALIAGALCATAAVLIASAQLAARNAARSTRRTRRSGAGGRAAAMRGRGR